MYVCENNLSALILKILTWWKVCWDLCGMQINSSCPSRSRTIQEPCFQINSNTPRVSELKAMSDIWIIWKLFTLNLRHLRWPQCCINDISIADLPCYQIQALAVRGTVDPPQLCARRESCSFLPRDLPHIVILPFWIASRWQRLGTISFTTILRANPTHTRILQMEDQSIVSDAAIFPENYVALITQEVKINYTNSSLPWP